MCFLMRGSQLTISRRGDRSTVVPCGGSQSRGPTICAGGDWLGETLVDPGALLLAIFLKSLNYAEFHR